jgi:hypothetical protein
MQGEGMLVFRAIGISQVQNLPLMLRKRTGDCGTTECGKKTTARSTCSSGKLLALSHPAADFHRRLHALVS